MKRLLFLAALLLVAAHSMAQSVNILEGDTIKMRKRVNGNTVVDIIGRLQSTGSIKPGSDTTSSKLGLVVVAGKLKLGNGIFYEDVSDSLLFTVLLKGKTDTSKTKSDSSYLKGLIDSRELLSRKVNSITSPNSTDYPTTQALSNFVYSLTNGKLSVYDTAAMLDPYETAINAKPSYGDVRSEISDSLEAVKAKTKNDSIVAYNQSHNYLRNYQSKVSQINQTRLFTSLPKRTANIAWIGDSVGGDLLLEILSAFWRSLGFGGHHGGGPQTGVVTTLGGGATTVGTPILVSSLTNNGSGTATVTKASHGLTNGSIVTISGASNSAYNKVATVTNVTANTFDYSITGAPTSPDPSTAIYFTASANFNKWVTGQFINLPVGGTWQYGRASYATLATDTFTLFKVYYVKESGGGTFKIQTSPDGSTWTDASGFTNIDCNDTQDNLGIANVTVSGNFNLQVRAVGLTGNCKIIAMGTEAASGAKISQIIAGGGLKMKDMATTPKRIWKAYLQDLQPDVIAVLFKDDTEPEMVAALQTFQSYINEAAPNCAVVYSSAYNSRQDDTSYTPAIPYLQTMAAQNAAIKQWIDTTKIGGEKYYFDANNYVGQWRDAAAKGFYDATNTVTISSATIASTTATITTATAHGIANGQIVRVSGVTPSEYNGLYTATVTGSNTFTYSVTTTPATSGSGGVTAQVDGTHLNANGRHFLSAYFARDFQLFSNFNMGFGGNLDNLTKDFYLKTGGTISGNANVTGTLGVTGKVTLVDSLITPLGFRIGDATSKMVIGKYTAVSGYTGIWFGSQTPTNTNFGVLGNNTVTTINATTSIAHNIGAATVETIYAGGKVLGSGTLAASSFYDINNTSKGVRIFPSMTRSQWNSIASKADGLFAYDNVLKKVLYFDGTNTRALPDSAGIFNTSNTYTAAQTFAKVNVTTGSNASAGTATLSSGTITVNTTAVTANSIILITVQETGTQNGRLRVSARTAGTSFTITSSDASDNCVVAWQIIN